MKKKCQGFPFFDTLIEIKNGMIETNETNKIIIHEDASIISPIFYEEFFQYMNRLMLEMQEWIQLNEEQETYNEINNNE